MIEIIHVANAGFLIEYKNKKILIDGIHSANHEFFEGVPENTLELIVNGISPFDNIDLLLFSHMHNDHFSPYSTLKFLENNPNTIMFSTKECIEVIKRQENYTRSIDNQLYTSVIGLYEKKELHLNGVTFNCISLLHDGENFNDVTNFSYIINCEGYNIFHSGDAKAKINNYNKIKEYNFSINLALLNFPYIALQSGRKIINNIINPERIIITHLPPKYKDKFNWINTTKKAYEKNKSELSPVVFADEEHDRWKVGKVEK